MDIKQNNIFTLIIAGVLQRNLKEGSQSQLKTLKVPQFSSVTLLALPRLHLIVHHYRLYCLILRVS